MKPFLIAVVITVIQLGISQAQTKIDFNLNNSCSYYGENITDDVYSFTSTQEARAIVQRILGVVGLEQNFEIAAANVPNALATIQNNQRLILYSQNFILNIKNATGTDWAGISILAHEIGHHLNGHTLIPGGSRPDLELQADKFSGFACAKLGASLQQAQAAMNAFASPSGSATHPPKSARIEAIAIGWNQGNSGSKTPPPPDGSKLPETRPDGNRVVKTTGSVYIVYAGDQYGCSLPVTITIGDKTFTPTGQTFLASDIPLGQQRYQISGNINCPMIGGCSAYGEGTIYVRDNSTFNVVWQNVAFAQCRIWLNTQ
jgi:hypothetical protein